MRDSYAHCQELVRDKDKDRFLSALFLPAAVRPHAFALYAFNAEIASVRDRAREPLAGEVRLQWWRDALAGRAAGSAESNPVARALLQTVEENELPAEILLRLIDAREFDLYDDPMPSIAAFEAYLRLTSSSLFDLIGQILIGRSTAFSKAAGHAGMAYGIAGLLRSFPHHAARGQLYVPAELLARHHVDMESVFAGTSTPALVNALAELRELARDHYRALDRLLPDLPAEAQPAFLPLVLADLYLSRMESRGYAPFKTPVHVSQFRRQWSLWRAARRAP